MHSPAKALYDPVHLENPTQMKTKLYTRKGIVLIIFVLLAFSTTVFSQTQVAKVIPYAPAANGIIGFLQYTPSDYGTQKHPLII